MMQSRSVEVFFWQPKCESLTSLQEDLGAAEEEFLEQFLSWAEGQAICETH